MPEHDLRPEKGLSEVVRFLRTKTGYVAAYQNPLGSRAVNSRPRVGSRWRTGDGLGLDGVRIRRHGPVATWANGAHRVSTSGKPAVFQRTGESPIPMKPRELSMR